MLYNNNFDFNFNVYITKFIDYFDVYREGKYVYISLT